MKTIYRYTTLIAIIIFLISSNLIFCQIDSFSVDEFVTFELANNSGNYTLPQNEKLQDSQEALNTLLTVNKYNPPFHFQKAWFGRGQDEHPPFYYALIHLICSIFPEQFSFWFSYIINLIFGSLTIFVFYRLLKQFQASPCLSFWGTLLFAVNPGLLLISTFLRMYMMSMFFCLLLCYLHIKFWNHTSYKYFTACIITVICGTLTHYYFLIYAFFFYVVLCIYDMCHRHWKRFLQTVLSMSIAAIFTIVINIRIFQQLFGGDISGESVGNLWNISDYFERILSFTNLLSQNFILGFFILFLISLFGIYKINKDKEYTWKVSLVLIPCILFFLVATKAAIYLQYRYLSPIFPMLFLLIVLGVPSFSYTIIKKRWQSLSIAIIIILCLQSVTLYTQLTFIRNNSFAQSVAPTLSSISEYDVLCVYDAGWMNWSIYNDFAFYNSTTFCKLHNINDINSNLYYGEALIVYLQKNDSVTINDLCTLFPQYNTAKPLFDRSYYSVFMLQKE